VRNVGIARFLDVPPALPDALTAAHQQQITHRDLKRDNVTMTADGRVEVLTEHAHLLFL
jgi:serine/threonine protein kinase